MRKSERIMLLLRGGGEWSALEVAAVLGLWFGPYAELHRMEREGKVASRWLDMPYPRRKVYFVKDKEMMSEPKKWEHPAPNASPPMTDGGASKVFETSAAEQSGIQKGSFSFSRQSTAIIPTESEIKEAGQPNAEPVAWQWQEKTRAEFGWAFCRNDEERFYLSQYPSKYNLRPLYTVPPRPQSDAEPVRAFAKAVLHGDDEHKAWLREAAEAFIEGKPLPAPRGKGTHYSYEDMDGGANRL